MEPLATIIDRLSAEKRLVVRHAESLSWGDRERCEALFREIFRRVDRTVVRYRPLPEYFFFNDTTTTEIYTSLFVGSVRCV